MRGGGIPRVPLRSAAIIIRPVARVLLLVIGLPIAIAACVQVEGGAIEASWVLRSGDGRAIESCACGVPDITRVRFTVLRTDDDGTTGEDVCAGRRECEFSCDSQRGATPFFIPRGLYAIAVLPIGADGVPVVDGQPVEPDAGPAATGRVRLQAPILREVNLGQPTQLEAFAIVVGCDVEDCNGSTPEKACSMD